MKRPYLGSYSSSHRRGHAQARVNAHEIIVRKVQSASGFQVRQLLRESVRQSGKSSHLHSDGQVLPLHVGRAYMRGIGHATNRLGYNLRDWTWGVAFVAVLAVVSE